MAYDYNHNGNSGSGENDLGSWLLVVVMLVAFWPIGLVLLFMKLTGRSMGGKRNQQTRQPYNPAQERKASGNATRYEYRGQKQPGTQGVSHFSDGRWKNNKKNVDLNKGKGMTVWGSVLAIFGGFISFEVFFSEVGTGLFNLLESIGFPLGVLGAGLVLLFCGAQRTKKSKRFRKYLALIGKRESISISTLAQAMPVSYHTACDDLQEMLDEGYIPTGYIDMGSGRLILSDEGIEEERAESEPEQESTPPADDDTILQQIRQVNDAIADPEMSRKIDRIGEITGKILDYQRKNPNKDSQLRSFLNYYLPTTLKILKAYAQMEAQGIEGANIKAAKARIEGMMDKVVEGFEKQLDRLFQDDAMDITTDVEVLERMLDKDGLSETGGLQLGI